MELSLHPRQYHALMSPAQEIFFGGAVGGGKSHLLRVASIIYSIWVPGLQVYLFRRTYKDLMRNHIHTPGGYPELLRDLMDKNLVVWNKSDNSFDFKNGSRIQLTHCQYDSDVLNYQGAQIGLLLVDESTHLSAYVYKFLRSRVRLGGLQIPDIDVEANNGETVKLKSMFPRIMSGSNPGNISHNFFKREFVVHGDRMWQANPEDGGMTRQFVQSRIDDNPTLTKNDPGYKDRVRGVGEDGMSEALLNGDWDIVCGGAVDDLWDTGVHCIDGFDIPRNWKIDRSYDYGSSAPYAVLWYAEANGEDIVVYGKVRSYPKGTIFVIAEIYGADKNDEGLRETPYQVARKIKEVEMSTGIRGRVQPGPADSSIFDTDRGDSIASMMDESGISWYKADKKPGSRVNGLSLFRQRLRNSVVNPYDKPGIYFFIEGTPDCRNIIATMPRDEKKPEDVDTKSNDHFWDTLRYRLLDGARAAINMKVKGF